MKTALIVIGLALALIGATGGNTHHHQWVVYETESFGNFSVSHYTISVICPDCGMVRKVSNRSMEK